MLGSLGDEGPESVVGAIGDMSDNFVKGTSDFTKAMLYGSKTLVGMGLNLLKNTLPTYMAVYRGTLQGNLAAGGRGGVMFDLITVPRAAVGQRAAADGCAAIRHVLFT